MSTPVVHANPNVDSKDKRPRQLISIYLKQLWYPRAGWTPTLGDVFHMGEQALASSICTIFFRLLIHFLQCILWYPEEQMEHQNGVTIFTWKNKDWTCRTVRSPAGTNKGVPFQMKKRSTRSQAIAIVLTSASRVTCFLWQFAWIDHPARQRAFGEMYDGYAVITSWN